MADLERPAAIPTPKRPTTAPSQSRSSSSAASSTFQVPIERSTLPEKTLAQEWRDTARELSAVVNVLVSMMAVATAAWWASGGLGQAARSGNNYGIRVLFSLLASIGIGAAESFLYYRFFQRRNDKVRTATKPALRVNTQGAPKLRRTQSESAIATRLPSPLNPNAGAVTTAVAKPALTRRASARGRGDVLRQRAIAGDRARRERSYTASSPPSPLSNALVIPQTLSVH